MTEREQALAGLDQEMKGLVHQRTAAFAEEERGADRCTATWRCWLRILSRACLN